MPATLKKLISKTNSVDIEIDGDPKAITVKYSTRKLTPRVQEEINALVVAAEETADDTPDPRPTIKQFLLLVSEWNLAEDKGEPPIPLEEERLMDVPIEILSMILDKITTDMLPKEATEPSSNGHSPDPPITA